MTDQAVQITRDDEARFWIYVEKTNGCWRWTSALNPNGYGRFRTRQGAFQAHRFAFELGNGPIPDGLELDHLCRNRACVNPARLEAVTHRENTLRGATIAAANAAKTHCPQGHPYDGGNTYVNPRGSRICRTCVQASRDRYAARRAAVTSGGQ